MKPAILKTAICILLPILALSCAGPSQPVQQESENGVDNITPAVSPPIVNPGDGSTPEDACSALLISADYDRAIEEAGAALETDPEDTALRERLADAYIARAWYYKAKRLNPYTLSDLGKAVEVAPEYYRAHYELGRFHNNQWQFSIGLLYLNKALSLKPGFAPAYSERGYSNYKKQDYETALAEVNKAIALDAEDGQFYYVRSLVYRAMGKKELAISDLETVLRLSKDNALTDKAGADLQALKK